jgi:hypothetical protein
VEAQGGRDKDGTRGEGEDEAVRRRRLAGVLQYYPRWPDERAAASCGPRAEDRVRCAGGDARAPATTGEDSAGESELWMEMGKKECS